jgi:hypothetical protein
MDTAKRSNTKRIIGRWLLGLAVVGEPITADNTRIADSAEWHGTALVDVSGFPAGDYIVTAVAYVAPGPNSGCSD